MAKIANGEKQTKDGDVMKNKYSKINKIAESMLEDENRCNGCPFCYIEYAEECYSLSATCCHWYYPIESMATIPYCNHNRRPEKCPIRWRNYDKK